MNVKPQMSRKKSWKNFGHAQGAIFIFFVSDKKCYQTNHYEKKKAGVQVVQKICFDVFLSFFFTKKQLQLIA